jgi:hypothetical protein
MRLTYPEIEDSIEREKIFDQALETHDAIQTIIDYVSHRKDVEVYVSLIADLEDLMVVIAKDMKGLQDGRTTAKYVEGDNSNNYIRGND